MGERWRYEGLECPRMYLGYVVYASDAEGNKIHFRLKHGCVVASEFKKYVTGPVVNSSELLRHLNEEGKTAFARVRHYLEPLPERYEKLLERAKDMKSQAHIYSMKVDETDHNALQDQRDLSCIIDELRLALRNCDVL